MTKERESNREKITHRAGREKDCHRERERERVREYDYVYTVFTM